MLCATKPSYIVTIDVSRCLSRRNAIHSGKRKSSMCAEWNTTEDARHENSVFIDVFFWFTNMTIDDTLIQPSRFSMKTRSMCQNCALDNGLLSNRRYLEERKTLFSAANMLSRCNLVHRPRTMSNYHKKMRKRTFWLGRIERMNYLCRYSPMADSVERRCLQWQKKTETTATGFSIRNKNSSVHVPQQNYCIWCEAFRWSNVLQPSLSHSSIRYGIPVTID